MMSCKDATRLASDALDRKLSTSETLKLRLHLLLCHYCKDFGKQIKLIRRMAQQRGKK